MRYEKKYVYVCIFYNNLELVFQFYQVVGNADKSTTKFCVFK